MADNMKELEAEWNKALAGRVYSRYLGTNTVINDLMDSTFHGVSIHEVLEKWAEGELVELDEDQTWPYGSVRDHVRRAESAYRNMAIAMGFKRVSVRASGESREGSDDKQSL